LYSLQMASSNLKNTTFTDSKKQVVTEMVESPRTPTSKNQVLPLINTDDTDLQKPLPRINADERGSGKRQRKSQPLPMAEVQHEHRLGSGL